MLSIKRNGFTMIELVFVIVVLGILAAVAVPRLAATRTDAEVAKGRSDVAAIRSAIVNERQTRLLQGDSSFAPGLDSGASGSPDQKLFDGNSTNALLSYPIISKDDNGHWMKTGNTTYTYKFLNQTVTFDYNSTNGSFTCNRGAAEPEGTYCKQLVD
jgi:general secretion pathway protein G